MSSIPDSPDLPPVIDDERAEHLFACRDALVDLASEDPQCGPDLLLLDHADELLFFHEVALEKTDACEDPKKRQLAARLVTAARQIVLSVLDRLDRKFFPPQA